MKYLQNYNHLSNNNEQPAEIYMSQVLICASKTLFRLQVQFELANVFTPALGFVAEFKFESLLIHSVVESTQLPPPKSVLKHLY